MVKETVSNFIRIIVIYKISINRYYDVLNDYLQDKVDIEYTPPKPRLTRAKVVQLKSPLRIDETRGIRKGKKQQKGKKKSLLTTRMASRYLINLLFLCLNPLHDWVVC